MNKINEQLLIDIRIKILEYLDLEPDKDKFKYIKGFKTYSEAYNTENLQEEIKNETPLGNSIIADLIVFTLDRLQRGKINKRQSTKEKLLKILDEPNENDSYSVHTEF